ncbi:MAG: SPFH domain-containing protein [Deltaproteobacteria bacterium]|nr:SPFH domain-containing protein [Deltaproteobacteria bacterium]
MGIGDFLKRGVAEMMVARPDEAKNQIIYKHPDRTIPTKAQLTVDSDEVALFFKDGKIVGLVQPGRHTLETSNIPFLSNLIDKFTGGNVLMAEVFFVTLREMTDFKFGGRIGSMEDPKSGVPVETMVHGTYSLKVSDPQKLLLGLVGMQKADNATFTGWFRDLLLKVIRDRIAELLVKKKWPLLDVTSGAYTEEVEEEVLTGCKRHIDDYGLTIMRLGNFVVSIKEEDEANLKKLYTDAAYIRMAGGMQGYQQFAAGKAMMGAGEGMAKGGDGGGGGGGLLGGAGLGVGFGLASMFQQNMGGHGQAAPSGPGGGFPQGSAGGGPGQVQGSAGMPAPGGGVAGSGVACAACGATVAPGRFCSECGQTLAAPKKFCTNCGGELASAAKFCAGCGTAAPR